MTVARAEDLLASVHIDGPITIERIATARQLLDEVGALDAARGEVRRRHVTAIEESKTTLTDVYGIRPLIAANIIGRVDDVRRFPTAGHFARHNGTAPIEASSGPTKRHRLNPRGDEPLQQRMREHVVGHHQGERLSADAGTRRQRREPVAFPIPLVAHYRHGDAPAPAHLEHVPVNLVGSIARDYHDLVESRVPGAGEGTLDEADTPA